MIRFFKKRRKNKKVFTEDEHRIMQDAVEAIYNSTYLSKDGVVDLDNIFEVTGAESQNTEKQSVKL